MQKEKELRVGFSLIELLIVIVILGGLVAVVAPGLMDSLGGAKKDIVCLKLNEQKKVFNMFKINNGVYPDTEEGFQALITNPDTEKYPNYREVPYAKKIPKDSWKTPLVYINNGTDIELISYGADRKEGGEGENKDIFLSECNK